MNKVETALRQITAADEVRYETDADLDAMVREYMKTPEDQVLEEEIQETLKKSFRKLSEKDLKLVFIAFGFEDGTPKSTNQVDVKRIMATITVIIAAIAFIFYTPVFLMIM